MTFDANQPNASQSPSLFPTANNTNYARLKTLINAEHVFNDTAQVDDGVHRQMTMVARTDPGSLPAGTSSMLYTKIVSGTPELYFYDGSTARLIGNSGSLTVEARVSWTSAGAVVGPNYNATVSYNGSSKVYTITFPVPLSSNALQFSLQGKDASSNPVIPKVLTYSTSSMTIKMLNQNATATGSASGYLIIFGS